MQVQSSTQTDLLNIITTQAVSQKNKTHTLENNVQKTESINTHAFNYFDLGEDISKYQDIDSVQEQTNRDIVNFLSTFMDNNTQEGKKNLSAFETVMYSAILSKDLMSEEEYNELETNLKAHNQKMKEIKPNPYPIDRRYSVRGIDGEYIEGMNLAEMKEFLGEDYAKNVKLSLEEVIKDTGIFTIKFNERQKLYPHEMRDPIKDITESQHFATYDGHRKITDEEATKLLYKMFQNRYSFSEAFTQTEKFQELYEKHREKDSELAKSISRAKPLYESVGDKEYLTARVVERNFSKSEAVDYYQSVSNELKDILSKSNLHDANTVKQNLKESIKLYDKIATGLKDMWGFGDLNVSV